MKMIYCTCNTSVLDALLTKLEAINFNCLMNKNKLQQVIINLLSNAKDSKKSTQVGKLKISSYNDERDIIIKFKDNGMGIASENLEYIFDAFFTTKEVGKGIGLGLSICHQLIKSSNGKIKVFSDVGIGTTFEIIIPITKKNNSNN